MVVFSVILVLVNVLFLILGGSLYLYLTANNIAAPAKPDDVFPMIALQHLPPLVGLIFIIGLVSALFPSADGAITALTSSFCIDILGMNKSAQIENIKTRTRKTVHLSVTFVFLICILLFKAVNTPSVIDLILKVAGYTYGPLVALYAMGLYSQIRFKEKWVPIVCICAPLITYIINSYSAELLGGYKMGFESAFLNVAITMGGLLIIKENNHQKVSV